MVVHKFTHPFVHLCLLKHWTIEYFLAILNIEESDLEEKHLKQCSIQ